MKQKAKILFILLIYTVSAVLLSVSVSADTNALITVETNEYAVAGGEFTIDIDISDNPGFSSASLSLSYDQTYLTLVSVELGDKFKGTSAKLTTSSKITEYPYKISVKNSEDITVDGNMLKARFKLSKSVKLKKYDVSVSCGSGDMKNAAGKSVSVKTVSGGFSLSCYHNYVVEVVSAPKCTAKGFTQYRCTECSTTYQDAWVDELPHTWKTVSTSKATCTEDGVTERKCSVCGTVEKIKNSDALGHSFGDPTVIPSTCNAEGYTLKVCTRCDFELKDDYQPLAEHTYEETYIEEATCENVGYRTLVCSVCEDKTTEVLPIVDHDYIVTEVFEATHDERGYTAYECRFCKIATRDNYTELKPYDLVYTVDVEPTCTEPGHRTGVCSDECGYSEEEELEPPGHAFGEWMSQGVSSEYRICERCGQTETRNLPVSDIIENYKRTASDPKNISRLLLISAGALVAIFIVVFFIILISHSKRRSRRSKKAKPMS